MSTKPLATQHPIGLLISGLRGIVSIASIAFIVLAAERIWPELWQSTVRWLSP